MQRSPALDERRCDYCGQPAHGTMTRVVPGDPTTPRVSLGPAHQNCLRLHYEAIDLLHAARQIAEVAL